MDYFISMVSVSGSISLLKLCLNISLHIRWFSQHKIIYHLLDFLQIFVTAGWKSHWKCLLNNLWYSNSIWLLFKFFFFQLSQLSLQKDEGLRLYSPGFPFVCIVLFNFILLKKCITKSMYCTCLLLPTLRSCILYFI